MFRTILLALLFIAAPVDAQVDPNAAVEQLLAADRAFSTVASTADDPVIGLGAMFDTDVAMPSPKGNVIGRDAVGARARARGSLRDGSP